MKERFEQLRQRLKDLSSTPKSLSIRRPPERQEEAEEEPKAFEDWISFFESYTPQRTPFLKWAGGKRWLAPLFAALLKEAREQELLSSRWRLWEPFCGASAVSLALDPPRVVLGDLNEVLIRLFKEIAIGLDLSLFHFILHNEEQTYLTNRDSFNAMLSKKPRKEDGPLLAALFFYLNRTGFNGLCRFNQQGQFNVPFGQYKSIDYYASDLLSYQTFFQRAKLRFCDFEAIVSKGIEQEKENDEFEGRKRQQEWTQEESFLGREKREQQGVAYRQQKEMEEEVFFLDPPYDTTFADYSVRFKWSDQERLATWVSGLSAPAFLINQKTERVEKLYKARGFRCFPIVSPRQISADSSQRKPKLDLLAIHLPSSSPLASEKLQRKWSIILRVFQKFRAKRTSAKGKESNEEEISL